MGEERRRRAEIELLKRAEAEWLAGLSQSERTAAEVSRRVHAQLVERRGLVGGCYLLAFFLHELLHSMHSIETNLTVGWVNDGTWPGVSSHAWVELGSKKIDISLTRTEDEDSQPRGDLLILDRVVRAGAAKYTYYPEPPKEATEFLERALRDGLIPPEVVRQKNDEHAYVLALSRSREGVRRYFSNGPPDRRYEALVKLLG